jgi:hypothetical protein
MLCFWYICKSVCCSVYLAKLYIWMNFGLKGSNNNILINFYLNVNILGLFEGTFTHIASEEGIRPGNSQYGLSVV